MLMSALQNLAWHGTCWATMWSRRNHRSHLSDLNQLFLFFFFELLPHSGVWWRNLFLEALQTATRLFVHPVLLLQMVQRRDLLWWVPWEFSFFSCWGSTLLTEFGFENFYCTLSMSSSSGRQKRLAQQSLWLSWFLTRAPTRKSSRRWFAMVEEEPPRPASSKGDPGDQDEWGTEWAKKKKMLQDGVLDTKSLWRRTAAQLPKAPWPKLMRRNFAMAGSTSLQWLQFLLPLHLFSSLPSYDKVPMAALQPTCTASKSQSMPNKKTLPPRKKIQFKGKCTTCFHQIAIPSFRGMAAMSSQKHCLTTGKWFFFGHW